MLSFYLQIRSTQTSATGFLLNVHIFLQLTFLNFSPFCLAFFYIFCSFMPLSSSSPFQKYISGALKLQLITFYKMFTIFSLAWSAIPIQVFSILTAVSQEQPFLVIIIIIYFCPPKPRSIFGLHRQPTCQNLRLGSD